MTIAYRVHRVIIIIVAGGETTVRLGAPVTISSRGHVDIVRLTYVFVTGATRVVVPPRSAKLRTETDIPEGAFSSGNLLNSVSCRSISSVSSVFTGGVGFGG